MRTRIKDLWTGDRFKAGGRLYTRLECEGDGKHAYARLHGEASMALGKRGFGYIGDALVSFPLGHRVTFVPPQI